MIVEDDRPTRDRLVRQVRSEASLAVVAAAATLAEARIALATTRPRVLLVDLDLPDGSGLELIRKAFADNAGTESMVITVFGDEHHVVSAIEAGAAGYILKDSDGEQIARALLQLLDGGSPISAKIARHVLRRMQPLPGAERGEGAGEGRGERLTPREHEVLKLIAKGYSYAEIAQMLGTSVHTSTSHVRSIYRKLAVGSRSEAVFEAVQMGIIRLDRNA
jgi:DNA-binding NarL/FixJ family response regulator